MKKISLKKKKKCLNNNGKDKHSQKSLKKGKQINEEDKLTPI